MGTVSAIVHDGGGCTLTIGQAGPVLGDCHIGDSIAVNGACLTVTAFDAGENGGWFTVWLANETLSRTDLGERKVGEQVNLERAMGAEVRFGGHFVQVRGVCVRVWTGADLCRRMWMGRRRLQCGRRTGTLCGCGLR